MTAVERHRDIGAAPAVVWAALADFGAIVAWAPRVDHSCLPDGDGLDVGTSRRIQVGRTTLVETVDACTEGKCLGYRIDGLPRVLGSVRNEWQVAPGGRGTTVTRRPPHRRQPRSGCLMRHPAHAFGGQNGRASHEEAR